MKLRERTRVGTAIRRIYELFEPRSNGSFRKRRIMAAEALKSTPGSNVTRQRAREYLGVKATNIAGRHVWIHPVIALDKALEKAARNSKATLYQVAEDKKKKIERDATAVAGIFQEIMQQSGYDQHPDAVKEEALRALGRTYSRGVISKARRIAGIISIRRDGQFHWLYPAKEVHLWLLLMLKEGPLSQSILFDLARAEKNWSPILLNCFRNHHGLRQVYKDGQMHWYDMNTWSPQ